LIGLILGIVALVKIGDDPALGGKELAIVAIVLPVVGIFITGILAAIAIPNFIRFEARSRQSECKANLKSVYVAEQAYYGDKDRFSPFINEIGFSPERGNRYAYFLGRGPVQDRSSASVTPNEREVAVGIDQFKHTAMRPITFEDIPPQLAGGVRPGIQGTCPDCSFAAVCVGNVDKDDLLDVWSISSEERRGPGGESIPAGQPHNEVNDVNLDR
jgi:type IV pilus assembly protein PilA